MKIGFIGFGKSVHRYHAPFIDQVDDLEMIGYYKRSNSKFEMPYPKIENLKRFASIEELLSSTIDIIVISTPIDTHYEYAKLAIENKKHVVVEKPFCKTKEEAEELYDLAKKYNVKLMPYQNRRFDRDFLSIVKSLKRDDIGKVLEVESNYSLYRIEENNDNTNKYDGAIYNLGSHFIDQIISLYGEPENVVYDIANQKNTYLNYNPDACEDYYDIKLIYTDLRVRIKFSMVSLQKVQRWLVNSTYATMINNDIDSQETSLKKGIFPYDEKYANEDFTTTIYKSSEEVEIKYDKTTYSEFYTKLIKFIKSDINELVTKEEALILLNIMETIINKQEYKKLNI